MLNIGTLKSFNSTDYRAEVQLAGSMAAYLDNIPVARNIASDQMTVGRHVILAIPGGNPKDACVIAVWDGAAGGGGGGASTYLALSDTPASYPTARFFPRINETKNAIEFVRGFEWGQDITPWQWELAFQNWTTAVTGSGVVIDKGYGSIRLETGTTANSTARGRGYRFGWINWANQDILEWHVGYYNRDALAANGHVWLKIDEDTAADPTKQAVGFRVDYQSLKGIVHNGTNLYVVDLNTDFGVWGGAALFLRLVKNDKIYWYVNGVLKGSSTHIPTTQRQEAVYCCLAVTNGASAAWEGGCITRQGWIMKNVG